MLICRSSFIYQTKELCKERPDSVFFVWQIEQTETEAITPFPSTLGQMKITLPMATERGNTTLGELVCVYIAVGAVSARAGSTRSRREK